jgi:hypothetical protein
MYPAGLHVGVGLGQTGIDDASLGRRVLVVCRRQFRSYRDNAALYQEFKFLAVLETSPPDQSRRDHERGVVFDCDGHDERWFH